MSAVLRVLAGSGQGGEVKLDDELVLGRDTFPDDDLVSRRHARVVRGADGSYVIEDLGSTNGTYLNNWRFPSPQYLSSGDRVVIGQTTLEVFLPDAEGMGSLRRSIYVRGQEGGDFFAASGSAALYAEDVRKSYGSLEVLKGVSLEVEPGEVVGLLGSNGAGKTTFVSIVSGLRTADGGRVLINGVDALAHPQEARHHVGIAPQDLGLYPTLTVHRNLEFFGELAGLRGAELASRIEEIGSALSLIPKFGAKASDLSGGQQRRLHTGMAMMHKPPLLILDEPTVGADIRTRQEILDVVKRMASEGHAICYSTHYMPEIEELGASVAVLDAGTIAARGSIAQLIAEYSSQAVQLVFDGPAPDLQMRGAEVIREGSTLVIHTDNPAEAAAAALAALGAQARSLVNLELIRPSLDSVYLALTQRRYSPFEGLPPAETPAYAEYTELGLQPYPWQQYR